MPRGNRDRDSRRDKGKDRMMGWRIIIGVLIRKRGCDGSNREIGVNLDGKLDGFKS